MLLFFLAIIVAAVVLTYVSLAYTQEKLGGPEADELGVGIAMILLGFSVFGFSGDIVLTRELFWMGAVSCVLFCPIWFSVAGADRHHKEPVGSLQENEPAGK